MSNKSARTELEKIYGRGCMFNRAKIAQRIEQMGGIKTYKKFITEKRYTLKKIKRLEKVLTYHHLKHRFEGGPTTVENGAEINELAHQYIHSLPREDEEIVNDMLREFKQQFVIQGGILVPTENSLEIVQSLSVPLEFDIDGDFIEIPAYDTTKEEFEKKFNRAKVKRETQQQIDEELYKYYNGIDDDEMEL